MCMERRRFSQTMASEWQTAFVLSQNATVCLAHCRHYNKTWKLQDFFFKTKTKCSRPRLHDPIQDQVQDFHFCPWGASRPRPRSRGLHHCFLVMVSFTTNRFMLSHNSSKSNHFNYYLFFFQNHFIRLLFINLQQFTQNAESPILRQR